MVCADEGMREGQRLLAALPLLDRYVISCTHVKFGLFPHIPIQESHHLHAGAGVVGGKGVVTSTFGDALIHRPLHSVLVESVRGHVGKIVAAGSRRLAVVAVQEGHHLAAGAGGVGVKGRVAGALGDALA